MLGQIREHHEFDGDKPAGGVTEGRGFVINWQNGPLMVDGVRKEPNGAFVEDVIQAAVGRLRAYQEGPIPGGHGRFMCRENALAITHLQEALHWLQHRTADREARGVEGTHAV